MGEVLERVIFLGGETKKGHTFSSACIIILCIFLIILEENLDNKIIDKMKKKADHLEILCFLDIFLQF